MSTFLVSKPKPRRRWNSKNGPIILAGIALSVIPALAFYTILFSNLLNIPFLDDYQAILDLTNHAQDLRPWERFCYLLTAQHNEYKLIFEHGILWLQLILFKRIDFSVLCVIGDLVVVLIGSALWKMLLPSKDVASRVVLFIPVAWLLFQLQYVETLNWAMASLQNLPVIAFSFAAIYLLDRDSPRALELSIFFLMAATASSANGLLVIPIGVLTLGLRRRYVHLAAWLGASIACVGIYFHHYYNSASSQSPLHKSILAAAIHINPLYPLSFIGNAAAFPIYGKDLGIATILCPLIGLALCTFFAFAAQKRGLSKNRIVYLCILFLLLTAIGVGCLRSERGLEQSLASRYGIYSALLLICAWLLIAERKYQALDARTIIRSRLWQGAVLSSMAFSILMDVGGYRYLRQRNDELARGMAAYERSGSKIGPILPSPTQPPDFGAYRSRANATLVESQRRGIY